MGLDIATVVVTVSVLLWHFVYATAGQKLTGLIVNLSYPVQETLTLTAAGPKPHHPELELTESMVLQDLPGSVHQLGQLRGLGVRLAGAEIVDGQSSRSLLRQWPADALKIDRSFMASLESADLEAAEEGVALIRLVIALAHTLRLEVVAEGVETPGQWDELQRLGCVTAQGHVFSPALPAAAGSAWLLRYREEFIVATR